MISVITVCYQSEKTIFETLQSVYNQKDVDIEHIIIDGESQDRTFQIIEAFIQEHSSKHIKYLIRHEKDRGMYDAINKGLKLASGDYIGLLHSDDTFTHDHVLKTIENTFLDKKIDACYGFVDVYENNKIKRKIRNDKFQLGDYQKSKHPAHPTFYIKKNILDAYGDYDRSFRIASDGEYMFRLLEVNQISHHLIEEVLVNMKDGGLSQRGLKSTLQIIKETKQFMKKHHFKFSVIKYIYYKLLKIKEYQI